MLGVLLLLMVSAFCYATCAQHTLFVDCVEMTLL
jgi:hypothetical protein